MNFDNTILSEKEVVNQSKNGMAVVVIDLEKETVFFFWINSNKLNPAFTLLRLSCCRSKV